MRNGNGTQNNIQMSTWMRILLYYAQTGWKVNTFYVDNETTRAIQESI